MPEPMYVAAIQSVNERFAVARLRDERTPDLDPTGSLSDALGQLGIEVPRDLGRYLDGLPVAIAASLVSVAAAAAASGIPLTFAWIAGFDYELTVAQADRDAGSLITVILRGPSPSDVAGRAAATST